MSIFSNDIIEREINQIEIIRLWYTREINGLFKKYSLQKSLNFKYPSSVDVFNDLYDLFNGSSIDQLIEKFGIVCTHISVITPTITPPNHTYEVCIWWDTMNKHGVDCGNPVEGIKLKLVI